MYVMPLSVPQLGSILSTGLLPLCATPNGYVLPAVDRGSALGSKITASSCLYAEFSSLPTSNKPFVDLEDSDWSVLRVKHSSVTASQLKGVGVHLPKVPVGTNVDITCDSPEVTLQASLDSTSPSAIQASINTQTLNSVLVSLWANFSDMRGVEPREVETITAHDMLARYLRLGKLTDDRLALVAKETQEYINHKKERELTYQIANKYLWYNPEKGHLTWKISPDNALKDGDEAGFEHSSDQELIKFKGHVYRASRVVWLLQTKSWPTGRIVHKDGDPKNIRWTNLEEVGEDE